jgi:hypothetical protein
VERMSEERVVKRLYQNTPEGSRNVGRPRLRWMDDVKEDLRRMSVTNWRIQCTQKIRLEDGREGGQGTTRTVEPRIQVKSSYRASVTY